MLEFHPKCMHLLNNLANYCAIVHHAHVICNFKHRIFCILAVRNNMLSTEFGHWVGGHRFQFDEKSNKWKACQKVQFIHCQNIAHGGNIKLFYTRSLIVVWVLDCELVNCILILHNKKLGMTDFHAYVMAWYWNSYFVLTWHLKY